MFCEPLEGDAVEAGLEVASIEALTHGEEILANSRVSRATIRRSSLVISFTIFARGAVSIEGLGERASARGEDKRLGERA